MRILALNGSFRKNGNTSHVLTLLEQELHSLAATSGEPFEFETIHLGHQELGLCRGCRVCFDRGEEFCPHKDDLAAIKAKVLAAEGIISASPVYVGDVSGIMKNWIDRMAHVCHRPELAGKSVLVVATTGSSSPRHTLHTMQGAWLSWGASLAGAAGYVTGAQISREAIAERYGKDIRRKAQRLYHAIQTRNYERPPFVALMIFRMQQRSRSQASEGTLDRQYWDAQGWTDPSREYYIPTRANRLTVAAARFVGDVFGRFVS